MCISNATKKGIKNLPVWGIYYKVLGKRFCSLFRDFRYRKGINIIPECQQISEGKTDLKTIRAGGHFFRNQEDAKKFSCLGEQMKRFRISRKDISHVGKTSRSDKGVTVLATKATML